MRVRRRPIRVEDVESCVDLMAPHPVERKRYGNILSQLVPVWKVVLRTTYAISGIVEDADAPQHGILGFGLNVFVTDEFIHRCKVPLLLWMGPELLRWHLSGRSPILTAKEIREANSRGGLNSVAWAAAVVPPSQDDLPPLQMELMNGFMEQHRGFLVKEVTSQPIESFMLDVVLNSGGLFWDSHQKRYSESRHQSAKELMRRPFILGADRKSSASRLNWASTLFQYRKPCIYFRPSEQRLLLAALKGAKDKDLSDELGVSLSVVKKTWLIIYDRARDMVPQLGTAVSDGTFAHRGKEKKQRVLSYLRDHPEELRPILPREKCGLEC